MILALTYTMVAPASYSIEGDGWFRFRREGRAVYAKKAELVVREGRLETINGLPLWPEVAVPTPDFEIATDGTVQCNGAKTGTVLLAYFQAPPSLASDGLASSPERPHMDGVRTESRILPDHGRPSVSVRTTDEGLSAPQPAPIEPPAGITLKPTAEVGGRVVTLQDVSATLLPANLAGLEVSSAPMIGARLALDSSRIEAKIRASGIMPKEWAGLGTRLTVQVTRASSSVPHDKLVQEAIRCLAPQTTGDWIAADQPGDFHAPIGTLETKAERSSVSGNTATVVVAVYVDGVRYNSRTVRLQRKPLPNMPARGAVVTLRVIAGSVVVESRGTVTAVDPILGEVTLKLDTGAIVTGHMVADGSVEVRR